jgi:hypothetical protein
MLAPRCNGSFYVIASQRNHVDQWRGGTIDPAVLIRPQSFCFKKMRRDDAMVRRVNGGQPDNFRGILGSRACDR